MDLIFYRISFLVRTWLSSLRILMWGRPTPVPPSSRHLMNIISRYGCTVVSWFPEWNRCISPIWRVPCVFLSNHLNADQWFVMRTHFRHSRLSKDFKESVPFATLERFWGKNYMYYKEISRVDWICAINRRIITRLKLRKSQGRIMRIGIVIPLIHFWIEDLFIMIINLNSVFTCTACVLFIRNFICFFQCNFFGFRTPYLQTSNWMPF